VWVGMRVELVMGCGREWVLGWVLVGSGCGWGVGNAEGKGEMRVWCWWSDKV